MCAMSCTSLFRQVSKSLLPALLANGVIWLPGPASAGAAQELQAYVVVAGKAADAAQGQQFFVSKHGRDWSCSSCHTAMPAGPGRHASTGKTLAPLAPSLHTERFTDHAKTEKWFRRNCNDVVGRECSAEEKANILAWLITFQR